MNKRELDPLVFCKLKGSMADRETCEHCRIVYLRKFTCGDPSDRQQTIHRWKFECDWCGDTRKKFEQLLRHGWKLRDDIAKTERMAESPKRAKRLEVLRGYLDQHRLNYNSALDAARYKIQNIRREHE